MRCTNCLFGRQRDETPGKAYKEIEKKVKFSKMGELN
jgi:hypothetical protein